MRKSAPSKELAGVAAFCLLLLGAPKVARAFCGFYVAEGEGKKLFADASQVVLMREGTRTVLSMSNDYKGPAEKFAMVIPVPVILQKENVKTLPLDAFDKVDKLGSPRLVEYWEQDPCPKDGMRGDTIGDAFGAGGLGLTGIGAGGGGAGDLGVKIEAKFAVGEYEIVILSAKDAGGLDTWLKQEKYSIPEGAEPYFKPYVQSGMKFFVAKVDPTKVKFDSSGRATLSPLRFHYDADTFNLPVRLGLINSSGTQDLIINILAKRARYEVANYPNVTIPTNLDVSESARGKFAEFYAALFDATVAKNKNAVVTEYSWDAGTCDPCPGPTLSGEDLATLGADVVPHGTEGLTGGGGAWGGGFVGGARPGVTLRQGLVEVTPASALPKEVIQRIVRQNFGRFRLCYEKALQTNATLEGTVKVKFVIGKDGSVQSASAAGDLGDKDKEMTKCVERGIVGLSFPQPENTPATVVYTIGFFGPNSDAGVPPPAPPPSLFGSFSSPTPYVLTRLHVRYSKESLGQDLVFKEAPAITGGREVIVDGALERGARSATSNNFQARYAIRHPWTGPIECKEPRRNIWGGPPPNAEGGAPLGRPAPVPAQKTAFVARGGLSLGAMIAPASIADAVDGGALIGAPVSGSSGTTGAPSDGGVGGSEAKKGGCGSCTVGGASERWPAGAAIGVAFLATARRRRQQRQRRA